MDAIVNTAAALGRMQAGTVQQQLGTLMVKAAMDSAAAQVEAVAQAVADSRAMMDAMQGRGTQLNLTA
ncbi:hypothetical protein [Caenispirillum bisanense]|uniref:hypothetical protein n=1 Tax=Caenispirillum bisanense TaxID=414052 RepID=UPI0031D31327